MERTTKGGEGGLSPLAALFFLLLIVVKQICIQNYDVYDVLSFSLNGNITKTSA